jgi:acyl-coenzyme A thioesterase PaaI-like protein
MTMNRFARLAARLSSLPAPLARRALGFAIGRVVPFFATAGVEVEALTPERVRLVLPSRRKVHNHLGGVHAVAAALVAEQTTGLAMGLAVPDDAVPLLMELSVRYERRMQGRITAEVRLDEATRARLAAEPRGELDVPVTVTDESGEAPITARLRWAWRPKQRAARAAA